MKNNYYKWAIWLYQSGFLLLLVISLMFAFKTTKIDVTAPLATDVWDNYGSIVGGLVGALFSLASILLLIHTIREQELNNQRQKIESRFFEMLGVYRENLNEVQINGKIGRYAIQVMVRELRLCIDTAITIHDKMKLKYDELGLLNFGYLAFFFGCSVVPNIKTAKTFRQQSKDYDPQFVEKFIKHCTTIKTKPDIGANIGYELFLGHQIRLGTYFRHLFHIVKFINNQPEHLLSYKERYEYMQILKAQFSPHEQILLFYHSLSRLGAAWEKRYPDDPNKHLITKYNLIRNIHYIDDRLLKYYPCVEYEHWPYPPCRRTLIEKFK